MKRIAVLLLLFAFVGIAGAQSSNIFTQYCSNVNTGGASSVVSITAPWYCNNVNAAAIRIWGVWEPVAYAAMLISFSIAAAIIMFGIALGNDRLRIFGIGEFYEATATALIVILFSFVAATMFGLIPGLFVGAYDPYSISLGYIGNIINVSSVTFVEMYQIGLIEMVLPSAQLFICIPIVDSACGVSYDIPGDTSLVPFMLEYSTFWELFAFFDMMMGGFMALHVEFYTIVFFMYAAIPVFLIPGIIFRSLIPTRHLGGMMMAIAIGFYFFMPVMFSFSYYFTSQGTVQQLSSIASSLQSNSGCSVVPIQDSGGTTRQSESCPGLSSMISPTNPITMSIKNAQNSVGDYWLSVLFFPALISAMTYAFITQIAEILGGMARTSGRLRAI